MSEYRNQPSKKTSYNLEKAFVIESANKPSRMELIVNSLTTVRADLSSIESRLNKINTKMMGGNDQPVADGRTESDVPTDWLSLAERKLREIDEQIESIAYHIGQQESALL